MIRLVGLRLLDAIPTLFMVLTLIFVTMRILPGDPAIAVLGEAASAEQLDLFRAKFGLDLPIWEQYIRFMWNAVTLNFGPSYTTNFTVWELIRTNLPFTVELALASTIIGVAIAIPLGVIGAVRRGTKIDFTTRTFSLIGYSIPDFFVGALLLIFFALDLKWFPINGGGDGLVDRLWHVVLPAVALALVKAAFVGRITRSSLLDVLNKDYVRTARAKGASERRVIYRHALRNALLPVITALGLSMLSTLSGSVPIELIFGRPGLGSLLVSAIDSRDYAVVQSCIIVFAMFVVLINLLIDIIYSFVDPRIGVAA